MVLSDGEAILQVTLGDVVRTVRKLGSRVGLHSAGTNPRVSTRALAQNDWVGFDVKAPAEDIATTIGADGGDAANWRSLECLLDSGMAYECRAVMRWRLFDNGHLRRPTTRLHAIGMECFVAQLAHPARQLDPQLPAKLVPQGIAQLWRELEELSPAFRLYDA